MAATASPPSNLPSHQKPRTSQVAAWLIDILLLFILFGPSVASLGVSLKRMPYQFLIWIAESPAPSVIRNADVSSWFKVALVGVALVFTYSIVLGRLYFNLSMRTFGARWLEEKEPVVQEPLAVDESPLQSYLKRNAPKSEQRLIQPQGRQAWILFGSWLAANLAMAASNFYLLGVGVSAQTTAEAVAHQVTQDAVELAQFPLCFLAVTLGFWFLRRKTTA